MCQRYHAALQGSVDKCASLNGESETMSNIRSVSLLIHGTEGRSLEQNNPTPGPDVPQC